jgi:predicted MPP superfamily phosphohydrolase
MINNIPVHVSPKPELITITDGEPLLNPAISRRALLKGGLIALGGIALSSCNRAVTKEEIVEITQQNVTIPHLPASFEGMTVTLASDFHSSPYMSPKDLKNIVGRINELKSDVILLPGDFVTSHIEELPPVIEAFSELKAKHGIFASTGNHDHDVDSDAISTGLESIGITMLRNENHSLTVGSDNLHLLGVDDEDSGSIINFINGKHAPHIEETFRGVPNNAATILLCHRPYRFDEYAKTRIGLMLSGHTHGGQIVLARIGKTTITLSSLASKFIDGFYDAEESGSHSRMYVSRGLGVVDIPFRLNCPPEITQFTLHSPLVAQHTANG